MANSIATFYVKRVYADLVKTSTYGKLVDIAIPNLLKTRH